MATVIKRNKILHIQYYNPVDKKITSKSTGLKATQANTKLAERYANRLQSELTKKYSIMKQIGIERTTIKDAKQHFLHTQQSKHPKTIKNFNRVYDLLADFFNEDDPCTVINKISAEDFIISLKKREWQINTQHTFVTHFIHFLNFLFEYNYAIMFKINRDIKTKPEVKEKIIFSDNDIKKIRSDLHKLNLNQQTTIQLLMFTGLRPSDLLSITGDKIDIKQKKLNYYSSKTKIFREIPFHPALTKILTKRIKEVGTGKLLNYKNIESIGRAVHRYIESLTLNNKNYSARTFRKTFITLCRNRFNMDPAVVRELVGHSHGNTTDKYYNQIDLKTIKNELKKFKLPGG